MADTQIDYYETLQVSANADPETIHRLFRILAQRFHPGQPGHRRSGAVPQAH